MTTASRNADETNATTGTALQATTRGVFRMMLSGIFIVAGANHLVMPDKIAAKLVAAPFSYLATAVAPAETLVVLAGVALLAGGAALLAGFRTRTAALLLFALIIPITITVQIGRVSTLGPLFKNIGLMGALLYFATHGADSLSLDALFAKRRRKAESS